MTTAEHKPGRYTPVMWPAGVTQEIAEWLLGRIEILTATSARQTFATYQVYDFVKLRDHEAPEGWRKAADLRWRYECVERALTESGYNRMWVREPTT